MKTDLQTLAHKVTAGWIRFWFPWVRFFEQQSVGDNSWQINNYEKQMKLICRWCNIDLQENEKVYCTDCRQMKEWRDK